MANPAYDVQLDDSEIRRLQKDLSKGARKAVHKAIGTSLSRTRRGLKVLTSKSVREHYNIKSRPVKKATVLTRINRSSWSFHLIGRENPISLVHFSGKAGPVRPVSAGVSVAVEKGRRKIIKNAFLRTDIHGNRRIFSRFSGGQKLPKRKMKKGRYAGKERTVIRALKGPSVADMFFEVEIDEIVAEEVRERFSREISQNLRFFLGRI